MTFGVAVCPCMSIVQGHLVTWPLWAQPGATSSEALDALVDDHSSGALPKPFRTKYTV